MKKAILLMSAVIAAKDGILLLDEFETAIHTSARRGCQIICRSYLSDLPVV